MYVLARANRPFASAADFWRRMAQESPGSIKFASSHPTTAERYLRLDQAAAEIQRKQASQSPLLPETKKK
jgi:type II secretory pathway component PulK